MKFLFPSGGLTDDRFGILTSPQHKGVPAGILNGMEWAADLGCLSGPEFVKRFDQAAAIPWLAAMQRYRQTCLFVSTPDHIGDAAATLEAFTDYALLLAGWPLAFVAQDGQEDFPFPPMAWSALFVGGSTGWKMSNACLSVIQRAQAIGKHIHIGRVNWWRRYKHFRGLKGSEEFTCDGTRQRYDGRDKTLEAWADYQRRGYQIRLPIFIRDSIG